MYKKTSRFMQSSPYSADDRREHKRRYKWTLEDREVIDQQRNAALSVEKLICNISSILKELPTDKFKRVPTEGLDNASCPIEELIGDNPKVILRELDVYLGGCLGYAEYVRETIKELSKIVEIDSDIVTQVDDLTNEIRQRWRQSHL